MNTVTLVDRAKLTTMSAKATGDRKVTIDAILSAAGKTDKAPFSEILKVAKPIIDSRNRKQESDYIVRYYVSELKNTFGAVDHDGKSNGKSSLAEFKVK